MSNFLKYTRQNKYELLLSFLLFTNLFPAEFARWLYYVSFLLLFKKMTEYKIIRYSMTSVFYCFIVFLWVTSTIGMTLDLRLILITILLVLCAPYKSIGWHCYKLKVLKNIFLGFGLATMANFYAKLAGINNIWNADDELLPGRVLEFAGFCSHSMWTSAAGAISALFFVSMSFRHFSRNKWVKWLCYALALVSLYVVEIAGSRSAFVLALASIVLIVKMQSRRAWSLWKNAALIAVTAVAVAPIVRENSGAMLQKKNAFEITTKNTSRDELWAQRMAEFKSSPLIGIGFAAHGVGDEKVIGRNESGGGYISVLAQAGIVGACFIVYIWLAAFMFPRKVGNNPNTILIYCVFAFMSFHSIFEGYLFQGGWYLCLVFWLVVGVLIEHKLLNRKYPQLMLEKQNV